MTVQRARDWLDRIHALAVDDTVKIMNVCGGHERTITAHGIRSLLPPNIELIPGPGCPVCICPEQDIHLAIQLALQEDLTLVSFGDMLRVPVNVPKGEVRTLEQARANGGDVRPVASPRGAVAIACAEPGRQVVFFAAGFETTMAPVAAMLAEGVPDNLFMLLSGRLTWPAVAMLLDSGHAGFDALIAPGHVSAVMGADEWRFVVEQYGLPAAIAGFEAETMLAAIYSVLRQRQSGEVFLDNCYAEVVTPHGNPVAKRLLGETMTVAAGEWRGIGEIPGSAFSLAERYAQHDARLRFTGHVDTTRRRAGEMPAGCDCASVVLGRIYPDQCRLYGTACTPGSAVGPCMVSDEGACRIWWQAGQRVSTSSPFNGRGAGT